MLAEAIDVGNTAEAANIAVKLAKQKLKITIQALFSETDEKPPESTINITVQVEDKESERPTLIKLDVDPNCSIGKLKYMVSIIFTHFFKKRIIIRKLYIVSKVLKFENFNQKNLQFF